jgi:hypothetical protein
MGGKLKTALVLSAEILGLLAVFVLFLLVLNYFKIISLPNPFYKTSTPTTNTVNTNTENNNQSIAPVNFVKLQNQATDSQISKFNAYAASFSDPANQKDPNSYLIHGVFSGFDNQNIQVVTEYGVLNLKFDSRTIFRKIPTIATTPQPIAASAGAILQTTDYKSAEDFLKNVKFGDIFLIFYSPTNLSASEITVNENLKSVQ